MHPVRVENRTLVYGTKLTPEYTGRLNGRPVEGAFSKEGFEYVVFGGSLKDWVLTRD